MSKPKLKLYPLLRFNESVEEFEGLEDGRNHLLYRVFFWMGTSFIGAFGLISFWAGRLDLAITLTTIMVVVLTINVYVVRTGDLKNAGYLYATVMVILIWFLVWHGGVNQTGPLWAYPLTIVVIAVLGIYAGSLFAIVAWIGSGFILLLEFPVAPRIGYDEEFILRLLAIWFAIGGLTWAIEFSRAKAYRLMFDFHHRVQRESLIDSLTNVLNRRGLSDLFASEESRFQRTGEPFSVLMIDVDNFKEINDSHGHRVGDEILRHMSMVMKDHIRGMDVLGRWGGEEFIILLSQTGKKEALEVAEKLRSTVENYRGFPFHEITGLTISVGVTDYEDHGSIDQMIEMADRAMYVAKRAGKNRVESL